MGFYRIALVAEMDCRADDRIWRCFEALRLAGHAVEVVDPRRFPNSMKDGAINRVALASFIDRFHPDYLGDGREGAEGILKTLHESGVAGAGEPTPRFVVFGFVGPDNFGDELIFSVICHNLEQRFPGAHIQCIGHNPAATLMRHGVVSTTCEDKLAADIMLRGAQALVYMAGILFDDPFEAGGAGPVDLFLNPRSEIGGQAAFTLMASMYGVPAVYLGIGAGPLENPDAQRLIQLEARVGARYFPRDGETERLLLRAGVPAEQVRRKADLAFLLDQEATKVTPDFEAKLELMGVVPGNYVAVSLREHRTKPDGFVEMLAKALEKISCEYGLGIVLVDLAPGDRAIHDEVRGLLAETCRVAHIHEPEDVRQTVQVIAASRAVVAMRLHCSIVANACGVASIGLDYNEKVAAFYELMGREHALLPMDCSADDLAEAFERLVVDGEADAAAIERGAAWCRAHAFEAFEQLEEIVRSSPKQVCEPRRFYPRSVSIEELEARELASRCSLFECEAEDARGEVARMKSSSTWKVGRALTALPRALKRHFGHR